MINQLMLVLVAIVILAGSPTHAQPTTHPTGVSPEDVKARELVERRMPEMRFDGIQFTDVVDFLRDVTSANIFVDWKTLEAAGINRNVPVTARLRDIQFGKALDVVLRSVGGDKIKLGYTVADGVITISTINAIAEATARTRVYDIRDLVVFRAYADGPTTQPIEEEKLRDQATEDIMTFLTETVDSDSWRANGGTVGSIRHLTGQLIITQTADNHHQITSLLDQFRERMGVQIMVETRFIELQPEKLPSGVGDALALKPEGNSSPTATLTEHQVNEILRAAQGQETTIFTAPRVTMFSGISAWVKVMTQQTYLSGYVVVKAEGQPTRFEPQSSSVEDGLILKIDATTDKEFKNVTLHFEPTLADLDGFESVAWPGAPDAKDLMIQKPKLEVREMKLFFSIPDGQTALISGWKSREGGEKVVYILAKPTIIQARKQ